MSKRMQYWSDHLAAIAVEGIQTKAYAKREGLSASALYYWRKHLKAAAGGTAIAPSAAPRASGQFVAVQVSDVFQPVRCSLTLAPGVRLELAQLPTPEWLAALAGAVARQVR
ncbi:MAG TPA: cobyrinic acid ac-diamide synthase [Pusillimonas sp.]|uniref:IS66 family insertion sequence element accessory protein TnpA n=1 Tax=Pusillimonas sp. TaxID=3040095 RepID=UPI002CA65E66|nr:cobyrinic acid ac-diamide synthase [Pusillimonas sp.]HUH88080.1 cobyrinic acid ac-diamide synthase [Pusillimonas sp.]